ncbi:MAG TPA: hypothetical protein EYQ79_07010 [Flavobacteriaceae bacterium]|jgi:hypothetical protein|nr:hypothetical protein [Flavobacteriaceae bacterium]
MKNFITKYLLSFSITVFILTLGFRILGSYFLSNDINIEIDENYFKETIPLIAILNIVYFTSMMGAGFFFGKKDHKTLPLIGIGFRYNLVSFLIFHIISLFWFISNLNSSFESIEELKYSSIIWGTSVLIHFYVFYKSKNKIINEINKEDLFD